MGWLGLALLVAAMAAFVVVPNPGAAVGISDNQLGELVYMGALLAALGGGMLVRYRGRFGDGIRHLLSWVAIALAALMFYVYRPALKAMALRAYAAVVPGTAIHVNGSDRVIIHRGSDGHFHAVATINGHGIKMLVDTGASNVILSNRDARAIGINVAGLNYGVPVATANGRAKAAHYTFERVTLGAITINNVTGMIARPGALEESLLGMSFLGRVKRISLSQDRLILTP